MISPCNKIVVAKLCDLMKNKAIVDVCKRVIFCSRSPLVIYQVFIQSVLSLDYDIEVHKFYRILLQLRKLHPDLICGLWLNKTSKANLPHFLRNSALFISALGAFYRNVISFVLGISVVFLHKNEYNA